MTTTLVKESPQADNLGADACSSTHRLTECRGPPAVRHSVHIYAYMCIRIGAYMYICICTCAYEYLFTWSKPRDFNGQMSFRIRGGVYADDNSNDDGDDGVEEENAHDREDDGDEDGADADVASGSSIDCTHCGTL